MTRFLTTFALIVGLALPAQSWAQTDEPAKGGAPAKTDEQVTKEMEKDVVLRALVDEIERGKVGLKLEDLQRPYFIEYALVDSTSASASADLGSLTSSKDMRTRMLRTDIRVGSYDLDNTNYSGDDGGFRFGGMFGGMDGAEIPIEDDYNAIRQGVWWATDREYKSVIENYESKLAFMKTKMIEDKPSDFSKETPTVYFEERTPVAIDKAKLEHLAIELSKIFKEYPDIQDSGVSISGAGGNKYLVNSEGTRLRVPGMRFALSITANAQADDGMKFSDSIEVYGRKWEDLPGLDDLSKRCREMVKRLLDAKKAPKLDSYSGPVLIDAEAAAALFAQRFANRFAGGQRDVGSDTDAEDFENKIGERILPKFLSVIDDPTQERIGGQLVMGHYKYDDQGVKVAPLPLVEKGQLQAQVMSRNPSKKCKQSNGHGRGVYRPSASTGCVIVTSTDPLDEKELKAKLLEKCENEDLEYGLRIAALGSGGGGGGGRYARYFSRMNFGGDFGGGRGGLTPLAMYKVFRDGREELVRGAQVARLDLKAFKRLLAAGDKPYVRNTGGMESQTTIVPALLFEELDLAKIDRDFDKPPLLPNPLARGEEKRPPK